MTRVDELRKKYATIPLEVIVQWEVLKNGVRDTDDLDKVSTWRPAGANFSYQSYDHDVTLKDLVDRRPSRLKDGKILRPDRFYTRSGLAVTLRIDSRSPYEIKDMGDGKFALFEGEEKVDIDILTLRPKSERAGELFTSKGTPVSTLISISRRCFRIMPVRYCEYFAVGEQCKFCNFNGTQTDSRSIGLNRPVTIDLDDTVEAYRILNSEIRFFEGGFELGGLRSIGQEGKTLTEFVGNLANASSHKPNFTIHTQAMDRKEMQRLKYTGLECITIQLEVWDPDIWAQVCPGKAKYSPHQRWLESCLEAVDVFGAGNVGCAFVGGVTMLPPEGHKTWQEARDSQVEGLRWMIKNGVMPEFTHVRIPPGSVYGSDYQALRQKFPPTEYYLESALGHHEAMLEYGLYQKLNKLMYCGFCCPPSIYCGQLGMLSLAGDLGKWVADAVPPEDNWLAAVVSSLQLAA